MGKRAKYDLSLPFNRFLKNNPGFTLPVISTLTGVGYFPLYHMTQGRMPTLLTAVAVEKFTKGELSCEDLMSPAKKKEYEEMKDSVIAKIA